MHLARQRLGTFAGGEANGAAGFQIDERRGDLAPVAKLEGALAEAASGDDADGVGHAAVDFDIGDEALAVFAVRVVEAEQFEAEHGHADAEDLSGADVSVGNFRDACYKVAE